jgi:nucleoside-diphosphate-sugar epimerase
VAKRVLVTGMSGLIGGVVRAELEGDYMLSALNRSDVSGVKTWRADLADLESMRPAFEGQDVVVHLAAKSGEQFTWEEFCDTNLIGTYNVLEAAREAGVERVVFASSGATVAGWEQEEPYKAIVEGRYDDVPETWPLITHEMATRPNGIYASTKVWGEAIARRFADTSALSVICLRIGYVNAENRPVHPRHYSVWCSQRDIAQAVARAVAASSELRYDICFVTSDNKWSYRDLEHSRDALGFEPQDRAEEQRP